MKERPILFSAPMVRAILEGRKTQTRRVLKRAYIEGDWSIRSASEPRFRGHTHDWWLPSAIQPAAAIKCPYGAPGDRLWVRETHGIFGVEGRTISVGYAERLPAGKTLAQTDGGLDLRRLDDDKAIEWAKSHVDCERWRPSIFMPRWASRITLELTGVRVERLGAITEADARAEGIFHNGLGWVSDKGQPVSATAVRAYEDLWHSINGSWWPETWVWVLEFKRVSV